MKLLEQFLKPTQSKLFKMLRKMYDGKCLYRDKGYILVKGEVPIMLVAHLDTVHKEPVREICKSKDGNILMSPQGIGGDDRCGVYALVNAYELSVKKPWLLFTCDEEIGGVGADTFCHDHQDRKLPSELNNLKCIVEVDRRGSNDAVYYECDNEDFEKYITGKGFKTQYGSFSDISVIAPELGVAAVNLSSGYYNAHTQHEYIVRSEINDTLFRVVAIVSDAAKKDFQKYEYVERELYFHSNLHLDYEPHLVYHKKQSSLAYADDYEYGQSIPKEIEEQYYDLVDYFGYDETELEHMRIVYGNSIITEIYAQETEIFQANKETVKAISEK